MDELAAAQAPFDGLFAGDPPLVLLTVEEAARRLRIGRTTCFKLVQVGEIESVTVGRLRRVPIEALPAFVSALRRRAAEAACARGRA
ncbi:excisionase family DNA-binding protein [Streptomyces sp. RKAG293]|uniref:excisionase family DNA-binding protein n=1 Tax=Streptomyces sp. RKAG293 TaxID=2893403 RepID=UPI002033FE9D|nr:excisionase family DNA-binding protein [Streptomyces sp. RKAG293]MCM2420204.1 excisionase family DNA-binding protein [Streptomyces sp. RKAG293]